MPNCCSLISVPTTTSNIFLHQTPKAPAPQPIVKMKTFGMILAALAASALAAPAIPLKVAAVRRSVSDSDVAASVNYILVLEKETSSKVDAYQNEVDAVQDPSSVLGRSVSDDDVAASVNYILVLEKETSSKVDAYQNEVDAVADPASVLGRRSVSDSDVAASVNYILVLEKETSSKVDAYQDEVDAINNPADVLGK
jgi:hypothetical protein